MNSDWQSALSTKHRALPAFLIGMLIASCSGCQQYPPASSRESMQIIKQLHTVCSSRDADKLPKVENELTEFVKTGKVSEAERQVFQAIITQAREGDWAGAEKAAIKLADDQIGNGVLKPNEQVSSSKSK